MTINLNKKIVTKSGILTHITDVDIYRFYTNNEVDINKPIKSPFGDDEKPSFGYFIGEGNQICFNDFRLGGGDCIKFVQLLFGLNYFEALSKIVVDFNLKFFFEYKDIKKTNKEYNPNNFKSKEKILSTANRYLLGKSKREWKAYDLLFWEQFGISISTLKKYRVQAIDYIFINGNPIKADKYAYCFIEQKDGNQTIKIYQPFNINYKWLTNHDSSVWQGWQQLPKKGDNLIITKSLKDVMSITSLLNIPAVSLQAEGVKPKEKIINELKARFKNIVLLYDNDFDKKINWGQKFAGELATEFNLKNYCIPMYLNSKDISDLYKNLDKIDYRSFPDEQFLTKKQKIKEIWQTNIVMPF